MSFCYSSSLSAFGIVSTMDFSHSNKCVVVSHYLSCIFTVIHDVESYFICLFTIFMSLVTSLLRAFDHFKISLFAFFLLKEFFIYFECQSLSDRYFTNTFFMALLFILLTVSFTKQKFLVLVKFNLSSFSFMDHPFGVVCKPSPNPRSLRFPVLSSRSFVVLHFTFRLIVHFKLSYCESCKAVSRIIFLCMNVWLFWHHLLKNQAFLFRPIISFWENSLLSPLHIWQFPLSQTQ